ncbi:MAG: hypothetical protein AAGA03_15985, partial [Planctomycetota bacterium]
NDMTFITTWWACAWSTWFGSRIGVDSETILLTKAARLSRVILSVVLFGGAVGKWTPEYWSGEVFYEIYFRDRDFWCFNWLRGNVDPDSLRDIATWYSRKVVIIETLAGISLWILPARWAAIIGMLIFTSIALFSNFLLFSVLTCLIGLASVGLLVKPDRD